MAKKSRLPQREPCLAPVFNYGASTASAGASQVQNPQEPIIRREPAPNGSPPASLGEFRLFRFR